MKMMGCTQCGRKLTDADTLYWQCAGCRKSIRATLPAMRLLREKKAKAQGKAILKCKGCGSWLDDGRERIFFKCPSCGKVMSGTLEDFISQVQARPKATEARMQARPKTTEARMQAGLEAAEAREQARPKAAERQVRARKNAAEWQGQAGPEATEWQGQAGPEAAETRGREGIEATEAREREYQKATGAREREGQKTTVSQKAQGQDWTRKPWLALLNMRTKDASGTKLCRHCKMEIPKGAKVCPHCRMKQGGAAKWAAIAAVALVVIALAAGGDDEDGEDGPVADQPQASSEVGGDTQKDVPAENGEESGLAEAETQAEEQPENVAIEYEDVFFYDLVGNMDDYDGKYVRTVVQVETCYSSGSEPYIRSVRTDSDLTGSSNDIAIYLQNYQEFDSETYITAEGLATKDGSSFTLADAIITDYGPASEAEFQEGLSAYKVARSQRLQEEKDGFVASCVGVSYDDLRRYPDTYKDTPIKLTITITDVEPDGWIFQGDIMASFGGGELAVYDDRLVREPRLEEGDTVTVYAAGNGLATVKVKEERLFLDKTVDEYEIPAIKIKYTENDKDFVE